MNEATIGGSADFISAVQHDHLRHRLKDATGIDIGPRTKTAQANDEQRALIVKAMEKLREDE